MQISSQVFLKDFVDRFLTTYLTLMIDFRIGPNLKTRSSKTYSQCALPPLKIQPLLFFAKFSLKSANCPSSFRSGNPSPLSPPLYIGFSGPHKNQVSQRNPVMLKYLVHNLIPSFKSN